MLDAVLQEGNTINRVDSIKLLQCLMLIFNGLSDFTGRMEHFLAATADSTTLLPLLVMLVLLVVRQFNDDADTMSSHLRCDLRWLCRPVLDAHDLLHVRHWKSVVAGTDDDVAWCCLFLALCRHWQ